VSPKPKALRRLATEESGGTGLIELLILLGLIALAAIASVRLFGDAVSRKFGEHQGAVAELSPGGALAAPSGSDPLSGLGPAPADRGPVAAAVGTAPPIAPYPTAELHNWEPRWHETPWIAGVMNGTGASIPIAIAGLFSERAARVSSNLEHYGQHRNLHNQLTGAYYAEAATMVGGGLTSVVRKGLGRATGEVAEQTSKGGWFSRVLGRFRTSDAERAREQLLATASGSQRDELARLSAGELAAIYPEGGPYPRALLEAATTPGFADLARRDPRGARELAELHTLYLYPATREGAEAALARNRGMVPELAPHPRDPRLVRFERGPRSPSNLPEVDIQPGAGLDHNGAFQQSALTRGADGTLTWTGTRVPALSTIRPDQLIVDGKPLSSMDGVMVFGSHGSRAGFHKVKMDDAARMVVDEARLAQARGRNIDFVVVDACSQREAGAVVCGLSSAQRFQRAINEELVDRGVDRPIRVLAADRPGSLYGNRQATDWRFRPRDFEDARFTDADPAARWWLSPEEAAMGVVIVGAAPAGAGLTAAGAWLYREVILEDDE
jgi:Flp pilus assembly pilin Flp